MAWILGRKMERVRFDIQSLASHVSVVVVMLVVVCMCRHVPLAIWSSSAPSYLSLMVLFMWRPSAPPLRRTLPFQQMTKWTWLSLAVEKHIPDTQRGEKGDRAVLRAVPFTLHMYPRHRSRKCSKWKEKRNRLPCLWPIPLVPQPRAPSPVSRTGC